MHDPLVSIIIPVWNGERFVGEAIASALEQTYRHVEVIIIDDGSTDASVDVIKSFGNQVRWESSPNRGACAARNRGITLAAGSLIQFLDADDILHPGKLEQHVPASVTRPGDMVYCDWESIDVGSARGRIHSNECGDMDPVSFSLRYSIQTATPLHWKSSLELVGGFREGLPCAQERDLHIRLACCGVKFHHLPKVLCTIRRKAQSVSSDGVKVLDQHLGIVLRAADVLRDRNVLTDARRRAFAGLLAGDARHYLRNRDWAKARLYRQEAGYMHPEGGLDEAYSEQIRLLRRICGPYLTELIAMLGRRMRPRLMLDRAQREPAAGPN
jgi:glycosyltransferase involved in cell wall biosynthesis